MPKIPKAFEGKPFEITQLHFWDKTYTEILDIDITIKLTSSGCILSINKLILFLFCVEKKIDYQDYQTSESQKCFCFLVLTIYANQHLLKKSWGKN